MLSGYLFGSGTVGGVSIHLDPFYKTIHTIAYSTNKATVSHSFNVNIIKHNFYRYNSTTGNNIGYLNTIFRSFHTPSRAILTSH